MPSESIDDITSLQNRKIPESPIIIEKVTRAGAFPLSEEIGYKVLKMISYIVSLAFSLFIATLVYSYSLGKELFPIIIFPIFIILLFSIPLAYYCHKIMKCFFAGR